MKQFLFLLSIALLLSSCWSVNVGPSFSGSGTVLGSNNFKYIKTVSSQSKSYRILLFGGKNINMTEAINKLRKNLKSNQALTNIATDHNVVAVLGPVFITSTLDISADIVEFHEAGKVVEEDGLLGKVEKQLKDPEIITVTEALVGSEKYRVDDEIIYASGTSRKEAIIMSIGRKGEYFLFDIYIYDDNCTKTIKPGDIFSLKQEYFKYENE